jgi:hypothetical protein
MSRVALAIILAVTVVVFHVQQLNLLSGSVEEFWRRHDENARISKVFFTLSLLSCFLVFVSPPFGVVFSIGFAALHLGFSMKEWKR